MTALNPPGVNVQMLIRRPAREVYDALADPEITTRFWFDHSSGAVRPGASLRWDWQMYGVSANVRVLEAVSPRRIVFEWHDPPHPVEFSFDERTDGNTLVRVHVPGFHGTRDKVIAQALDSTGGFSFVLAAMKAWLEHGIVLELVGDHAPDNHAVTGWSRK